MNPIAPIAPAAAPRDGAVEARPPAQASAASAVAVAAAPSAVIAPRPPNAATDTDPTADKRIADEPTRSSASASDEPDVPQLPQARPAAPLKSFAQIPTEVMAEISRLREEAAEATDTAPIEREDPTPMPASERAIGVS